jgi:lipopolysaccharide/colanic/teichoic acid biosynthesis glycosyltransferase
MVNSLRVGLAFTLVCAVGVPLLAFLGLRGDPSLENEFFSYSLAGVAVCATISMLLLRRLESYPGVNAYAYVFPVVAIIFAVDVTVVAVLRLPYSAFLLSGGFLGTLAALLTIASLRSRRRRRHYALVPGGRIDHLRSLPTLVYDVLLTPELPHNDAVIVADLHHSHAPEWERFLADAAISGVLVYHYKQVWEAETGKVQIEHLSENSFGSLVPGSAYGKLKRFGDLVVAIAVLPLALPLMGLVALAIKRDSAGPAVIRQIRMGYRGRAFGMLKFRTMHGAPDAPGRDAFMTRDGDNRITRFGRFLRRTRLDELPQIVNIIRGQMSWIGPRPEALALSAWYEQEIPFYRYRHIVRPGMSGWAQVNQGHVTSIGDVDTKLQLDFYYIKNFSYWIDTLIAFRTVRVMLTGFGAK